MSIGGNAATATSATTATNIAGGTANQIPFQTGAGATSFIVAPTVSSTALTWNGSAFTWSAAAGGLTISDDTTTNATRYLTFTSATTGTITSENVSSTKLTFNPSTGILAATGFSGAFNGTIGATTANTGEFTTLSATGVTTVQAGTASLPAITTSGDTNTGIFFPAADTIAFSEGGVEAMRIDSDGDVGIGTSSPAVALHVLKTTAITNAVTQAFRIDSQSSGTPANGIGVGIEFATETAAANTEIGATIEAITTDVTATSEDFDLSFKTMAAGAAAAERMRVKSNGDFLFNSGYGSVATAYGCRAWVNFNGTGTPAIRGSGNVTSITDNGVGNYTVNFTTAMPDTNYAVTGAAATDGIANNGFVLSSGNTGRNTTNCNVLSLSGGSTSGTAYDSQAVNVAFFR